jgi:putative ABC transport system permease protein
MTALMTRLLGRLPIGWLQLAHNKSRLAAAVAGVAFANLLILMQLGFQGALVTSIGLSYQMFNADVLLSASDANTIEDGSPLPRARMYEALATPGVADATPLYYGRLDWKQPDGTIRNLAVFGIDPSGRSFKNLEINSALDKIKLSDHALLDRRTRNADKATMAQLASGKPYTFEANNLHTLTVDGLFTTGGGFSADGYLVVSDQTFLKIFKQRLSGAPNHIFLTLKPGANREAVMDRLNKVLPPSDTQVRTIEQAIIKDTTFQTTQKPVGIIFGFGVFMGVIVGIIIVYQVLSTDVADHLKEYATFKAIGYPQRFFLGIVFEEALILAVMGFIPGVIIALGLYQLVAAGTGLPITMPLSRPILVLFGTIAMCMLSGALATRRLARADPADLF